MASENPATEQVALIADAVATAGMTDEEAEARRNEEAAARKFFKQFDADQKFDKNIRVQIRKDRAYASGEAQARAPVSTNMIGSAIDIQCSTLYARDPDVSATPAPQVDPPPDPVTGMVPPQPERRRNQDLAKSIELVLSRLWKKGMLKPRMRRVVRSILSASYAILKVLPETNRRPDPLAQSSYNTLQENIASVGAQIAALEAGQTIEGITASAEDLKVQEAELQTSMEALSSRLEVEVCYGFTFDVVKPENLQFGTDVELLEEYRESNSLTEIMYFPHDELREKFPDLKDTDLLTADKYYRKAPRNANKGDAGPTGPDMSWLMGMYGTDTSDEELYTTNDQQDGGRPLAKVLEKWNKADNHIYTTICGVKVWARKPYMPSWASSRFYPYFYFSLMEVDGQRCPQSGAARAAKLQDEYASVRSSQRVVRQRSIPGVIFDAAALADVEIEKLTNGQIAEYIGLRTVTPGQDFNKMFAAKPVPNIDQRLYDTSSIQLDLERTLGVSDTDAQSKSVETTATEEEIKASKSNARTSTWRDTIETVLSEMAHYCAEIALQKIPPDIAAKIAGPAVLWPHGLALEDINSLFEVSIAAGTTGKPRNMGDREAWATIAPLILETQAEIFQLKQNPMTAPLATAKEEVIRETMRRYGDESDLSRFIPQLPDEALLAAPVVPGAPGAAPGEAPLPGELPPDPNAPIEQPPAEVNPMQAGIEGNGFQPPVM